MLLILIEFPYIFHWKSVKIFKWIDLKGKKFDQYRSQIYERGKKTLFSLGFLIICRRDAIKMIKGG